MNTAAGYLDTATAPKPTFAITPAARVGAGAVILLAALGMILLGGCFLIGVLILLETNLGGAAGPAGAVDAEIEFLRFTLYAAAFLCFAGAIGLFIVGLRGLLAVLWGRYQPTGLDPEAVS